MTFLLFFLSLPLHSSCSNTCKIDFKLFVQRYKLMEHDNITNQLLCSDRNLAKGPVRVYLWPPRTHAQYLNGAQSTWFPFPLALPSPFSSHKCLVNKKTLVLGPVFILVGHTYCNINTTTWTRKVVVCAREIKKFCTRRRSLHRIQTARLI